MSSQDGDLDVCAACAQVIRRTTVDPMVPWVHAGTGNAFCDVDVPEDAVMFAGTPGRSEASPVVHDED